MWDGQTNVNHTPSATHVHTYTLTHRTSRLPGKEGSVPPIRTRLVSFHGSAQPGIPVDESPSAGIEEGIMPGHYASMHDGGYGRTGNERMRSFEWAQCGRRTV
jgi:hypothetical protein